MRLPVKALIASAGLALLSSPARAPTASVWESLPAR